jgi:hypothetical protein
MNKARYFSSRFLSFLLIILTLYYLIVKTGFFTLSLTNAIFIIIALSIIFNLGLLIIAPGLNKTAENFVMRFMILTTVQMLSVLSIILVMVYLDCANARVMGFHLISLFCLILAIQSGLLIRINSNSD